ncbi:MAG: Calx-beta domain-containing protein, partial [Aurantibacter sp.]
MRVPHKFLWFLLLLPTLAASQANITIEVNWPNWSSENRVTFRDPGNNQIGARICNPGSCYNGCCNNSYNNIGSPASYPGIAYGTGYDILLQDTWGDGLNGFGSYVRVYQDGVLIVNTDLTGGTSGVFTFDILAPTPVLTIDDISVNEGDGTATFTVTHTGANTSGAFTVNYTTSDVTTTVGSDYSLSTGTLNFNGTVNDTEQIVVPISDDSDFEGTETYSIQLTATSDPSVDITATGTGTIVDNDILGDTPLALYEEFDGYMDYTAAGGTLRTQDNVTNACSITTSSSGTLTSPILAGATIEKAYLYWSHSNATPDSQVTFEGNTVTADLMYSTSLSGGRIFYGGLSDVTSIILGIANPSTNTYDFSGLTVDNSATYCDSATVLG